jgi:hypothetical protein
LGISSIRQPQDDVAVALARTAQMAQAVDDVRRQPDVALALLVGHVLVAHGPERLVLAIAANASGEIAIRIMGQARRIFQSLD